MNLELLLTINSQKAQKIHTLISVSIMRLIDCFFYANDQGDQAGNLMKISQDINMKISCCQTIFQIFLHFI